MRVNRGRGLRSGSSLPAFSNLTHASVFVPLEHSPGDAQADFGEAMAVIGGVERKAHYLAVDLPQSDEATGKEERRLGLFPYE